MTDMTAEQALHHLYQLCWNLPANDEHAAHELIDFLRQALTAPRVPDGVCKHCLPLVGEDLARRCAAAQSPAETVAQSVQDEPSRLPAVWIQPGMMNLRLIATPGERAEVSAHYEPESGFTVPLYAAPAPAEIALETDLSKMSADYPGAVDWTGSSAEPAQDELAKLRARVEELEGAFDTLLEEYDDRKAQFGDEFLWHKHEDKHGIEQAKSARLRGGSDE